MSFFGYTQYFIIFYTMAKIDEDSEREERITDKIVVDDYDPEERDSGWFYHLSDNCTYPYKAKCVIERSITHLKKGEKVEVLGIGDFDDCQHEMFVLIRWESRELAVPLIQLEPIDVVDETKEVVEDWHYWVERGYQF